MRTSFAPSPADRRHRQAALDKRFDTERYEAAAEIADGLVRYAREKLVKAATPKVLRDRGALFARIAPQIADEVAAYFAAFADRAVGSVSKAISEIEWDPDRIDWGAETDLLAGILLRWYVTLGEEAFAALAEQLQVELRFDLGDRGMKRLTERIGTEVRGINATSRAALADLVTRAIDAGYSIDELVRGVAADGFPGIRGLVDSWASTPDGGAGARAQTIALTETATAYNLASLTGYEASGLVDEVEVFDGPECGWTEHDDPDLADGSTRTLDDAAEYPTAHPHCQRAFGPVVAR